VQYGRQLKRTARTCPGWRERRNLPGIWGSLAKELEEEQVLSRKMEVSLMSRKT
jgi:hypothetical protein